MKLLLLKYLHQNHYYSYGLKVATLSSKKLADVYEGSLKNNYLYQGAYSELDEDIGWHDFALRNYDAQVGRFVQQDPFQQFSSPYVGMANDPVNTVDPSGGSILHCPGTSGLAIFLDNAAHAVSSFLTNNAALLSKISIGISIAKAGIFVTQAIQTSNMINGQVTAMQVGAIHFTPGGQQMYFPDDNPELFSGETVNVGNLSIQPMSGSVHAFTITGVHARNGAVRFVAMFDRTDGKFTRYSWDKDLSYTYDDYIKEATEDFRRNLEHANDPMWDPDLSEEEAAKNTLNWGLTAVIPNVIFKTATAGANAAKVTVLGKYGKTGEYINYAKSLKANYFSISENIWIKMSPAKQWAANVKFLDKAIERGDKFILSHSAFSAVEGSSFWKELQYLFKNGYEAATDGMSLIKK